MKAALSSLSAAAYAALILQLSGAVLIIGSIADCLLLLVPPNFLDPVWLTATIRSWILSSIIPLIGVALLLLGSWVDAASSTAGERFAQSASADRPAKKAGKPGRRTSKKTGKKSVLPRSINSVVLLSLCYAILFVLLIPLYFNSSRLASAAAMRDMNQQAEQAEQQLGDRLNERREQIQLLLSDNARRQELEAQIRDAGDQENQVQRQFTAEQQTELQQLLDLAGRVQENPAVLEQELRQAQQDGLEALKAQQQQERDRITAETRRFRIHTILMAILLVFGYGGIAWTGMTVPQKGRTLRNSPKRQARSQAE